MERLQLADKSGTVITQHMGMDLSDIRETPAYRDALAQVRLWRRESPGSRRGMQKVENALKEMTFFQISRHYRYLARAAIPADLPQCFPPRSHSLEMFFKTGWAVISQPDWNSLGPLSQKTALIHMALRYIQLNPTEDLEGNDVDLLELASRISLNRPSAKISLDQDPFFHRTFWPPSSSPKSLQARVQTCKLLYSLDAIPGYVVTHEDDELRKTVCGTQPLDNRIRSLLQGFDDRLACAQNTGNTQTGSEIARIVVSTQQLLHVLDQDQVQIQAQTSAWASAREKARRESAKTDFPWWMFWADRSPTGGMVHLFHGYERYLKNPRAFSGEALKSLQKVDRLSHESSKALEEITQP